MKANEVTNYGVDVQCQSITSVIKKTAVKGYSKVKITLNDIGLDTDCNFYHDLPELFFKDGYDVKAYYLKVKNIECVKAIELCWGTSQCSCEYINIESLK